MTPRDERAPADGTVGTLLGILANIRDEAMDALEPDEGRADVYDELQRIINEAERGVAIALAATGRFYGKCAENERLRDLLREAWEFPNYPAPGEGLVSTAEDVAEQERWQERYDVLDLRIKLALTSRTEGSS